MSKLSIVIAAVDGTERLESGLVSVLQHRPANSEVLVVLAEPYVDPYELQGEVCFIDARRGAALVECLNLGWQASTGSIVHFLASGLEVAADWADEAMGNFDDPRVATVAPLVLWGAQTGESSGDSTYSAGVTYSAGGSTGMSVPAAGIASQRQTILGPHLEAGFYRKSALQAVGGVPTGVGQNLAGVDLVLALGQVGYRAVFEPASRVAVPWHPSVHRRGLRHGLHVERLFWRNAAHRGWIRSLAAHPLSILGECLHTRPRSALLTELLGRTLAACQIVGHARRREELRQIAAALAAIRATTDVSAHEAADEPPTHLRFDAAHAASSRSNRGELAAPVRRHA